MTTAPINVNAGSSRTLELTRQLEAIPKIPRTVDERIVERREQSGSLQMQTI